MVCCIYVWRQDVANFLAGPNRNEEAVLHRYAARKPPVDIQLTEIGMYSKADWGGSVDPFIRVKFFGDKEASDTDAASLMIFEWKDVDLVQLQNPETKQKVSSLDG